MTIRSAEAKRPETSTVTSETAAPRSENHRRWHNASGALHRLQHQPGKENIAQQSPSTGRPYQSVLRSLAALRGFRRTQDAPSETLAKMVDHHEVITTILLAIVSGGVMLLTYTGVSMPMTESGAGIIEKGHALSFAVVIGVLSWIGWSAVFTFIPRLTGRRLALGLSAGTLFVGTVAAIDAPMNMLALAGPSAVQMSLVDVSAHYEDQAAVVFSAGTRATQLAPALRAQAERFRSLQTQEVETGAMSGSQGPGRVSEGFGQIAVLLTTLADSVESGAASAASVKSRITEGIRALKAHAYTQGDIRARSASVSSAADAVDELLALVGQFDFTVSVSATVASLESLFPTSDGTSKGFAGRQDAELDAIAQMARSVAQSLRSALGEVAVSRADTVRPLSAMQAIRHYWWPLLPQWVAAIFTDIAPAFLLLVYLAARREAVKLRTVKEGL
jgi:hypothetical protein